MHHEDSYTNENHSKPAKMITRHRGISHDESCGEETQSASTPFVMHDASQEALKHRRASEPEQIVKEKSHEQSRDEVIDGDSNSKNIDDAYLIQENDRVNQASARGPEDRSVDHKHKVSTERLKEESAVMAMFKEQKIASIQDIGYHSRRAVGRTSAGLGMMSLKSVISNELGSDAVKSSQGKNLSSAVFVPNDSA